MSLFAKRAVAGSSRAITSTNKGALFATRAARAYSTPAESAGVSFGLSEDQEAYRDLARKFAREEIIPNARHHDQTMVYPTEIIKKAEIIRTPGVTIGDGAIARLAATAA